MALSSMVIGVGAISIGLSSLFSDHATRFASRITGMVLAILGSLLCVYFYLQIRKED